MVIIPSDQLTLSEKVRLREGAVSQGLKAGSRVLSREQSQLEIRHAQTDLDFLTVGRSYWATATLNAANTDYAFFTTLAAPAVALTPQLTNDKLAVFYAISVLTVPNPISLVSFRQGTAVARVFGVVDLEQIEAQQVMEGYLSQPVVYEPLNVINIVGRCKIATGAQANIVLHCYIVEPKGTVTS